MYMYMYYLICSLTYDIDLIFLQDIRLEVLDEFEKRSRSFFSFYIKEYQYFHNHVSKTSSMQMQPVSKCADISKQNSMR